MPELPKKNCEIFQNIRHFQIQDVKLEKFIYVLRSHVMDVTDEQVARLPLCRIHKSILCFKLCDSFCFGEHSGGVDLDDTRDLRAFAAKKNTGR